MNPDAPLFCFDTSRQALIFAMADGSNRMMGIQVGNLQGAGWNVTDAGLRACLPRFGAPALHHATDMTAARELAKTLNGAARGRR